MEFLAITIIILWLIITFTYGYFKSRGRKVSVEEWFVAGRRLGLIVLWLSLGANIYSSYTFLAVPGIAARSGFSALAITLYGMIGYILGFWLVPLLWRSAKKHKWLTIADAFKDLYNSRLMGAYAALTSALWSIPYIQLQLQGMGYIIHAATYGQLDRVLATIIAFIILALIVTIGGLVSVTSINALQGAIMLVAIWFLGILSPIIFFGGYDKLFNILSNTTLIQQVSATENATKLGFKFHLAPTITDYLFLYTLIFAAPLGFWLWPNRVQNVFGAANERIVKRNMVLTSIYQLSQIPVIMVGLTTAALFITGTLTIPKHMATQEYTNRLFDYSFMLVAINLKNPIVVGFIGAGALAASLSTAAAILHACGALFSRNIVIVKKEETLLLYARMFTFIIAITSLLFAIFLPDILISLLLVGYAGIIQLFPEYLIKLKKPELLDKYTAITASTIGMVTVFIVKAFKPFPGVYEGFIGIIANLLTLTILITTKKILKSRE